MLHQRTTSGSTTTLQVKQFEIESQPLLPTNCLNESQATATTLDVTEHSCCLLTELEKNQQVHVDFEQLITRPRPLHNKKLNTAELENLFIAVQQKYEAGQRVEYFRELEAMPLWKTVMLSLALYSIRLFLMIGRNLVNILWAPSSYTLAPDQKQVLEGVIVKQGLQYGCHEREFIDCIMPFPETEQGESRTRKFLHRFRHHVLDPAMKERYFNQMKAKAKHQGDAVLFIHGGGWVIEGSQVQVHTVTPWARKGFVVYALNYPLAPENKFPIAVVSVLKGLHHLRTEHNVNNIQLVGESAGAGLATLAIALLSNPKMLKELSEAIDKHEDIKRVIGEFDIVNAEYPTIASFSCWYGLTDKHSWKTTAGRFYGLCQRKIPMLDLFKYGVDYCLKQYTLHQHETFHKWTIHDYLDDITHFNVKNIQFVTGGVDPLGLAASNVLLHKVIKEKLKYRDSRGLLESTHKIEHLVFSEMSHAFVSLPVQFRGADCVDAAKLGTELVIDFFKRTHKHLG